MIKNEKKTEAAKEIKLQIKKVRTGVKAGSTTWSSNL